MGYRSEVAICIKSSDDTNFVGNELAKIRLLNPPWWQTLMTENEPSLTINPVGGLIHYRESDIKWYEGYAFVDAMTSLYNHFDTIEEKGAFNGAFLRLGENTDDIEEHYINDGYDLMSISQDIVDNVCITN